MPEISDADLKALNDKVKAGERAQTLYDGLLVKYNEAKAVADKVPAMEQELSGYKTRELESTFSSAGIKDEKVRRIFQMEYDEMVPETGKQKPPLTEWLAGLQTSKDLPAHLKPFLAPAPAPASAGAGSGGRSGTPDVNRGAKDFNAAKPPFTAEQIAKMTPNELRAAAPALAQSGIPGLASLALDLERLSPTPKS